jgi:hypothetical protein
LDSTSPPKDGPEGAQARHGAAAVPLGDRGSLLGCPTASFQALGGSWLLIDWDAIRLPAGITAPR